MTQSPNFSLNLNNLTSALLTQEAQNSSPENSDTDFNNGRWTYTEHLNFLKGCIQYGNNWKKVEDCVQSRKSSQIRSHAQKYLIKLKKQFTKDDPIFLDAVLNKKMTKHNKYKCSEETTKAMLEELEKEKPDFNKIDKTIIEIFAFANTFINTKTEIIIPKTPIAKKEKDSSIIFNCQKVPKKDGLDDYINNCLESYDFNKFNQLLNLYHNGKYKTLVKKLCCNEYLMANFYFDYSLMFPWYNEFFNNLINQNALKLVNIPAELLGIKTADDANMERSQVAEEDEKMGNCLEEDIKVDSCVSERKGKNVNEE